LRTVKSIKLKNPPFKFLLERKTPFVEKGHILHPL
jgi:hypothetical protein